MQKHRSMKYHYYIRGAILLGFTTYIAYLAHLGKLNYYIVPRMIPYVMLTTLALYVLALYSIYLAWQERGRHRHEHVIEQFDEQGQKGNQHEHGHGCNCEHEPPRSKLKSSMIYSLFIFPIVLGFSLPDQFMGSDVVAVKGMNLSASQTANFQQTKSDGTGTGEAGQAFAGDSANSAPNKAPDRGNEADQAIVDNSAAQYGDGLSDNSGSDSQQNGNSQGDIAQSGSLQNGDSQSGITPSGDPQSEDSQSDNAQNSYSQSDNTKYSSGQDAARQAGDAQASDGQNFEAMFPSDQYSVELAELGKLLYQQELIEVKEEGFLEVLTTLDLFRENFIGKSIKLSGFVYREADMSADSFVVSRMAMQCCSADASPYGFLVQSDEGKLLDKDAWVEVTGTLGLTKYNDVEIVQLQNVTLQAIEAPDDPYVYPYFGYFPNIVAQ